MGMNVPGATTRAAGTELLSTFDVVRLVGVTYRVIDRWAREAPDVLGPSSSPGGSGTYRGYTVADLARLQKAAAFHRATGAFVGGGAPRTIHGVGKASPGGPRVDAVVRFVLEAVENSVGDWVWECDDFTLIVAADPGFRVDG